MSIDVQCQDRIAMSQKERDLLKVMGPVVQGQRTQSEAARLAGLSVRQIRRIQRMLEKDGDAAPWCMACGANPRTEGLRQRFAKRCWLLIGSSSLASVPRSRVRS